jgi:maleylacetoacetate isomerase
MTETLQLYSYWRSSAAYRVRIGLNLKGLAHSIVPVHLLRDGGQQHSAGYREINPQELVPTLCHGQRRLGQSLAILEYLDEFWPEPPLLPANARARHRARALAQLVACDVHPLNNLRVLQYFEQEWNVPQPERDEWVRHWIVEGFRAAEAMLADHPSTGIFCEGDSPAWPTAAWCRRSTTRAASAWTWRRIRPSSGSSRLPGIAGLRCRAAGTPAGRARANLNGKTGTEVVKRA